MSRGNADGSNSSGRNALFSFHVLPLSASFRVQFRAGLFLQRWATKQEQELLWQKKEVERQNRLEALRNEVDCYLY